MKNNLSPKQLGQAVGVSESSLKRWIDDGKLVATRTLGGHRRIPISEAVRFIRASGLSIVEPQVLGMEEIAQAVSPGDEGPALLEALKTGQAATARGILVGLYLGGTAMAELFDGPLTFAMTELGRFWEHDDKGIYIEHRATDICISAVGQIRALLPSASPDAPAAIGGAPIDDPYLLGSLAAATTLQSLGWRTVNLGPQTPLISLRDAALDTHANVIWISVSTPQGRQRLKNELKDFAQSIHSHGIQCVVGGREMTKFQPHIPSGVHLSHTMAELSAFCSGLTVNATSQNDDKLHKGKA